MLLTRENKENGWEAPTIFFFREVVYRCRMAELPVLPASMS
jgi:hypothetical protein